LEAERGCEQPSGGGAGFPYTSTQACYPTHPHVWINAKPGRSAQEIPSNGLLAERVGLNLAVYAIGTRRTTILGSRDHGGLLRGTNTLARERSDGINYVILLNKDQTNDNEPHYTSTLLGLLEDAMDNHGTRRGHTSMTS